MIPKPPSDIDTYIAGFPREVQRILQQLRATILKAAPGAEETIKYGMPTFMLDGNLVYFAAWKKHVGFYGLPKVDGTLKNEIAPFAGPKGNLTFPFDQPIPFGLITKLVKRRVKENRAKKARASTTN